MSLMDFDPLEHLKSRYTSSSNQFYYKFITTSSCDPTPTEEITVETLKEFDKFVDFCIIEEKEVKKPTLPMAPVLFDPKELVL